MLPQITCASALPGKMGNMKIPLSLKCCISALPEFNQSLLDFFSLFESRLILALLYDSLNLVINAFIWECCSSWTVLNAWCTSVLSSEFPVLKGNAEALDRWGGKTKHRLISYFLSNTSAKNYRIWVVYVKITVSQMWDIFLPRDAAMLARSW